MELFEGRSDLRMRSPLCQSDRAAQLEALGVSPENASEFFGSNSAPKNGPREARRLHCNKYMTDLAFRAPLPVTWRLMNA